MAAGSALLLVLAAVAASGAGSTPAAVQLSGTGVRTAPQDQPVPAATTPALSADGRYLAFSSSSATLVPGDTNSAADVFVLDRTTGSVERVSVSTSGVQADGDSVVPSISADGRFVAFDSLADNLVDGATEPLAGVYLHDRQTGTTRLVSVDQSGQPLVGTLPGAVSGGGQQAVSDDGHLVVFQTADPSVAPGADTTNARTDVYVRNLTLGTTTRVSVAAGGGAPDGVSFDPVISGDGSTVAFDSSATNLVAGDTNGHRDVFVRHLSAGTTTRVSVSSAGAEGDEDSADPSISQDGSIVAFESLATNLVAGDTNGLRDVFVRDLVHGTTELASTTGSASGNQRAENPRVTRDGSQVLFVSKASNLVGGDTNNADDIFDFHRTGGGVTRLSVGAGGVQSNGDSGAPATSADGGLVGFVSAASNLSTADANNHPDLFLRDVAAGTTSLASPSGLPNLVVDGSFEPPDLPTEGYFDSYGLPNQTHLGAWQFDRGGVDLIHDVDVPDGLQFIDLNGNGFDDPGKISQTVSVQDHHLYQVSFALSANTNGAPTIKTLDVSFGGVKRTFSADLTGHTSSNLGWTVESFQVPTCGVTSSPLVFDSTTPNVDGGQKGPQLDAISVVDVTPPGGIESCTPPPSGGATTTAVTSSVNPSVSGQAVTWTATVSTDGGPATAGMVQWKVDGVSSGLPVTVGTDGQATSTRADLGVGAHTIEADYLGADGIDPSQGTLTQTVHKGATSTVVTSSANPVPWGQSVTFTATVSPHAPATSAAGAPGGSVSFSVDGVAASSATLAGGQATYTVALPPGPHSVVASYPGDARFTSSQSAAFAESVTCDHDYTGNVTSVVVTSGTACVIGATVTQSVSVSGSGSLAVVNSTVAGSVSDNRGARLLVCNTHVQGSVVAQAAPGPVTVGDPASGCAGNTIVNSLVLVNDTGHVVAVGNQIGRSLVNSGNADADVHDNTIG